MNWAHRKQSALLALILLLCGVGAWVSNGLLKLHDGALPSSSAAGRLIAHLCSSNPDEPGGCAISAQSVWADFHLPIPGHPIDLPVAFIAIAYFFALAAWYAFVGEGRPAWSPLRWLPIALGVVGIYASLFFVSLMALGRSPWCGGCVAVHFINLLLVISMGLSRRWAGRGGPASTIVGHRQSAAVIVFSIALIGIVYAARTQRLLLLERVAELAPCERMAESLQNNPKLLIDAYLAEPKQVIAIRPDEASATAKHELVIFLDFECPACLITDQQVRGEIAENFGNTINVVVRHYPLCRACNTKIPRTIHPIACRAAYAAEAARALGGMPAFERMSNLLFATQSDSNDSIDRDLAIKCGIDPYQFLKLLDDPAVKQRVAEDVAQAHALGVNGTPTLFLDGRLVPSICMTPEFWKALGAQRDPSTSR